MRRIDDAIKYEIELRNMIDYLDFLMTQNKLSNDEVDVLEQMIRSSNKEDSILAIEILKNRYNYVASMSFV